MLLFVSFILGLSIAVIFPPVSYSCHRCQMCMGSHLLAVFPKAAKGTWLSLIPYAHHWVRFFAEVLFCDIDTVSGTRRRK